MPDALGRKLKQVFTKHEAKRRDYELLWAQDLRQDKGQYDPQDEAIIDAGGGSKVYMKYTRSKTVPALARVNHMLFPNNDKNWNFSPTPSPRLTDKQKAAIMQSLTVGPDGKPRQPSNEELQQAIKKFAADTCTVMETTMEDQLVELGNTDIDKKVIRSGFRFGTGIKKGPTVKTIPKITSRMENGEIVQVEDEEFIPDAEFVSLWYWYPDITAVDMEDLEFSFELHNASKYQLRQLAANETFRGDVILQYIKDNPEGDYKYKNWQIDIQDVTDQGSRKYELLEYWGYIDGKDVIEAGVELSEKDKDKEIWCLAFILGESIIKVVPTDIHPYHLFYFEKDDTGIFGTGLPRAIRDTAISICAGTRELLDHAAECAGAQYEVNEDLVPEDRNDYDDIHSGKVWQRRGKGVDAQYQGVRLIQPQSRISEYIALIKTFFEIGDLESAWPTSLLAGEPVPGGNDTVRGTSMRHTALAVTLDDLIKNFDKMNGDFLKALYQWNMKYNPDERIKGDANVKAVGSESLVAKELRTQALDFFATTLTPSDEAHVDRNKFLRLRAKIHDLNPEDFIRTDQEAQQYMANMRDEEAIKLAKAEQLADIHKKEAMASHLEAKAGSVGTRSNLDVINSLTKTEGQEVAKQ